MTSSPTRSCAGPEERDRRLQRRLGCLGMTFSMIGIVLVAAALFEPILTWDQAASWAARAIRWIIQAWAAIVETLS